MGIGRVIILTSLAVFCFISLFAQQVVEISPDTLVYKQVDTTSLEIYMYKPVDFDERNSIPAVVFFHGGGWNKGKPKAFHRQSMYLASRGIIAFSVQYRVREFNGTTPFDAVEDAKSAIRYVRTHAKEFHINPEMIAAGGGSAGGHIAAAAGVIDGLEPSGEDMSISSNPNALLLYNPVIDNSKDGYGYRRMAGRYMEISPLHNIKKGAPPTIFFLGTKDKLIPVSTAEEYKRRMEKAGSRCDLFLYQGGEHSFFTKQAHFAIVLDETDRFLVSLGYLKGESKVYDQYLKID